MPLSESGRVEVDFAEWSTRPVQEVLPAQLLTLSRGVRVAVADGFVELDRLGPAVGVVVAQPASARVAVEWASYCEYPVTMCPPAVLSREGDAGWESIGSTGPLLPRQGGQ
ncbi:hypothetical protein [Amycolatopsis albispora]|uniref:hypothetical protein n=1 Tax=Amycolatopsis albispora TaxID=1804986 RepID=UPI0013B44FE6|nr:hypothetical protein [Amycolatopsis albispora]